MNITIIRARTFVAAAGVCLVIAGCATKNIRTHPDIAGKAQAIKTVLLADPEIRVYEVSAGGVPELMDNWSAQGKVNVTKALIAHFNGTPVKITALKPDSAAGQELKEVMALFEAVSQSIINHTSTANNNPNIFPDKLQNFDYSVGSLEAILNSSGGDALLLVYGADRIATAGKKALNTLGTITGIALGAVTGVAIIPRTEGTVIRIALASRDGTILWYNIKGGVYDLREPDSSTSLVDDALEAFPVTGR